MGQIGYDQYFGGENNVLYPSQYPDGRAFPLSYGGDIEDYIGTTDSKFAGVYVWRPYNGTNPVNEFFVKYGDIIVKRTFLKDPTSTGEVYQNFIFINREFGFNINGLNMTQNLSSKRMDTKMVWTNISSNNAFKMGGGTTNITLSFTKTGTADGSQNYSRVYYHTKNASADFIFYHHWYMNGEQINASAVLGTDNGVNFSNNIVVFDTDYNGYVNSSGKNSTGWALVWNDNNREIGAFNTTKICNNATSCLFTSNQSLTAFLRRNSNQIEVTINTMEIRTGIDFPIDVNISINMSEMINNTNGTIKRNSDGIIISSTQNGEIVSFIASGGALSETFIISGNGTYPTGAEGGEDVKQFYSRVIFDNDHNNAQNITLRNGGEIREGFFHQIGDNHCSPIQDNAESTYGNITNTTYGSLENVTWNFIGVNITATTEGYGIIVSDKTDGTLDGSLGASLLYRLDQAGATFGANVDSGTLMDLRAGKGKPESNLTIYKNFSADGREVYNFFVNNTFKGNQSIPNKDRSATVRYCSEGGTDYWIDRIVLCNSTEPDFGCIRARNYTLILDTSPPEITLINLTSEGGLGYIIYNNSPEQLGNFSGQAKTNDTTPTFFIKTDESSTCAVIDNNKNLNWSVIYSGNTNLDSGAPTTTHTLTLNDSNKTRVGLWNFSIG